MNSFEERCSPWVDCVAATRGSSRAAAAIEPAYLLSIEDCAHLRSQDLVEARDSSHSSLAATRRVDRSVSG